MANEGANEISAIRQHLQRVLDWSEAHVTLDEAVEGLAPDQRGARAGGFEHSPWELLEHIRLAQDDILDFTVNPAYRHTMKWPDDYWPTTPAPPSDEAWQASLAACRRAREALQQLARDVPDLAALVPRGKAGQTYLRAILLTADHTAYHVGQLVAVRRALGAWR